jgi:hypothetical protein
MTWETYSELQRLCIHASDDDIIKVRSILESAGTLAVVPTPRKTYPASGGLSAADASGYQRAWLRDNVMIAFSRWYCGDPESAWHTVGALQTFMGSQASRFDQIIAHPELKEEIVRRPHVRFDPYTLEEVPGEWANAQNDALGDVLWLRYIMANAGKPSEASIITTDEQRLHRQMIDYLSAIQYWTDADSGCWEEERKVNSSSIGAVLAALKQMLSYGDPIGNRPRLEYLYRNGRKALQERLPFESPPQRLADAALLLLIFPYDVVEDLEMEDKILSLVRARLTGSYGIRRYVGDSYYCQDYEKWFKGPAQTADFSKNIAFRNALLVPEREAQWCLFDPIISTIYSLRVGKNIQREESHQLRLAHFRRSIAQLTPDLQCPELYYYTNDRYAVNEHMPLAWTQANLSIALHLIQQPHK